MEKFTIEEIKNYLLAQDSLGDIHYNLNEDSIINANKIKCPECLDETRQEELDTFEGWCETCNEMR